MIAKAVFPRLLLEAGALDDVTGGGGLNEVRSPMKETLRTSLTTYRSSFMPSLKRRSNPLLMEASAMESWDTSAFTDAEKDPFIG
jgi:hypothetical protein